VQLRVAHLIEDTEAEGPGRRFAVWVQGCSLRCPGCCNPELFGAEGGALHDVAALAARVLAAPDSDGLSLLGGEPFEQAAAAAALATLVRAGGRSVMVFTGYTLAELEAQAAPGVRALLDVTDVLVDGRYQREQPDTARRWVGSQNQVVHLLTGRYRADDPRWRHGNSVELRLKGGQLTVSGWPEAAAALKGARR
jgi:anaerobic ribonucleoside-triphosphate reductase activating protein